MQGAAIFISGLSVFGKAWRELYSQTLLGQLSACVLYASKLAIRCE
jgi:hypothetical protein